jgi:hypothetical protein
VRERNNDSFVRVPTEPDFFILFLIFIAKAKSKNLAVNGSVTHERLQPLFALHIGAVMGWWFCRVIGRTNCLFETNTVIIVGL